MNIHQGKGYICPESQAQYKKKKKKNNNNNKQAKICAGDHTSEEGAEGEEGEWASTRVSGSPEWSAERDSSASSSLGMSKLKSRPG